MRRKEQRSMLALAIVMAFVVGVFWAGPVEAEPPFEPGDPCAAIQGVADRLGCELGGTGAPVEKTGQTTSCATGDDGDLEKGVAWPDPRFTANEDGTVTDNLTGLIWLQDANRFGTKIWTVALTTCNELEADETTDLTDGSVAGDWRLPNVKELQSLIDYGNYSPCLPTDHPFSGVESDRYWSSTPSASTTGRAWGVDLDGGRVGHGTEDGYRYVWPVRGGE